MQHRHRFKRVKHCLKGKQTLNRCLIGRQNPPAAEKAVILPENLSLFQNRRHGSKSVKVFRSCCWEKGERGRVGGLHYYLKYPADPAKMAAVCYPSDGDSFPLLLFLHGSGERGKEDGSQLKRVLKCGPWRCAGADRFLILAPQCPLGRVWPSLVNEVLSVLNHICDDSLVDKSRIYIMGHSMGAFGAWSLAVRQPQMFAALVSICGGFVGAAMATETSEKQMLELAHSLVLERRDEVLAGIASGDPFAPLQRCVNMPAWLFYAVNDTEVSPEISHYVFTALGGTGSENLRVTAYATGHNVWEETYDRLDLYTWLLNHEQRESLRDATIKKIRTLIAADMYEQDEPCAGADMDRTSE